MKFCIYAICKNESKFVERWYNSIKDADYICVLDTGSTDNTLELLEQLKQQHPKQIIYSQKEIKPWRFDTARNESMKLIPTDANILVSADLDDVFPLNWRDTIIKYFNQGYNKIIGSYPYYDKNNNITYTGIQDRVCWNDGNSHWENGIHERLITANENKVDAKDFIIEHRQDLSKPRRECYLEAAKNSLEPGNYYGQLCYGYELCNSGYPAETIKVWEDLYNQLPKDSEYLTRKWVKLLGELYGSAGQKDKQIYWLKEALTINHQYSPFEDYILYTGVIEEELKKLTIKVCVYAICKNELKNIYNWIKPLKTADYICVLDTGSTDGTYEALIELKKDYPNLYVEQKYYEHFYFDDGRNDSLALARKVVNKADTNILLCLDIDEYASDDIANIIKQEWSLEYQAIEIYCKNVNMYTVKGYLLTDDLHWKYKIHEEIDCEKLNKLVLQNGYYNHYQDLSKDRNYYKRLQEAHEADPTCIHYLTYLIWEASLHNDLDNLKKYCEEDMYQILYNKDDQYYLNSQYYIYACLVYIDKFNVEDEFFRQVLKILDMHEEDYREYYLFKAKLAERIKEKEIELKNLIKASLTNRAHSWIEGNFKMTESELLTKIVLIYYYNIKDYEKAYLYADKAYHIDNSELHRNNLNICEKMWKEHFNE